MYVSLPLRRFIEYMAEAREFDRTYPELNATGWLTARWAFDDQRAYFGDLPERQT
jgi:hypothetical protein